MESDALFLMGTGKAVCKDYATHHRAAEWGAAIISDGCSQSPKSDIGARLLAECFLSLLVDFEGGECLGSDAILTATTERVRCAAAAMRLPPGALDATLVAAVAGAKLRVFMWGDGHVFIRTKTGESIHYAAHYANSAPYYLSYEMTPGCMADYRRIYGEPAPSVNGIPETPFFYREHPMADIACVCVFSDGLTTFTTPETTQPLPAEAILSDLADFKSYPGAFVQRRMRKFQKNAAKSGLTHYDDISCAALAFPEEIP